MHRRLLAAALLAVLLAPGTMLRTPLTAPDVRDLRATALSDGPADGTMSHGFTREGLWELASADMHFGGFSALLVLDDATLRAFSDRGRMLTFAAPGSPDPREPRIVNVWNREALSGTIPDIEGATRDPETGTYWLAFENSNALIRFSIASEFEASRQPPRWQDWPENGGAEAFARLPDGRFLVLPERGSTGLLYPDDPVGDIAPLTFSFSMPLGYQPTDMAALPDGRVLVLLRQLDWTIPPFDAALAIADPRALAEGDMLELLLLVKLDALLPRENYEALALAGVEEDGAIGLWLMSDDNLASFQRTLLARLSWEGDSAWRKTYEKAREG